MSSRPEPEERSDRGEAEGSSPRGSLPGGPSASLGATSGATWRSGSVWLLLALGLAGLALALGWSTSRLPTEVTVAEARFVAGIESLRHDRDLAWDERDRARAVARWGRDPWRGSSEPVWSARDLPPALAALPFFLLGGSGGLLALGVGLTLGLVAFASRQLEGEGWTKGLWLGGLFLAHGFVLELGRLSPFALHAGLVFVPLALWLGGGDGERRRDQLRWVLVGGLGAAAELAQPGLGLVALLPAVLDLVFSRRLWAVGLVLTGGALVGVASLLLAARLGLTFELGPPSPAGLTLAERFWGGSYGIVPAFPFALAALLGSLWPGSVDRRRWLLAAGLLAAALGGQLLRPLELHPGALGDARLAALVPAAALVLPRVRRLPLALGALAALVWTLPALGLLAAKGPEAHPLADRLAAFRLLPVEAGLAPYGLVPGYRTWALKGESWQVPAGTFFVEERHPNGVWVRGSSSSEVVLVAPRALEDTPLRLHALAHGTVLRATGGGRTVTVRFDSLAKLQGTEVRLPLELLPAEVAPSGWRAHRLRIDVEGGVVASEHDRKSLDRRYLGVFLDLTGAGP
ncbi:MAG TPA: hypothetical protein VF017_09295 [Thermoanaerobaculia bacterium]|nr:hypothetical protein [Thermoanaerobaculia bacterium]